MSNYQANIIIKNPATPTGPSANGSAPGIWRMNEVAYWIKQGVWPNANILPDPYFPYVSTLLSTTSLGNANNNLFVDSSGAFNPISRNGNTTQGSVTPYSANWSNYFDGSGDFLSIADNAAFDFGTGNFTMECWVYLNAYNGSFASQIFGAHTFGSSADYIFNINTTGKLCFQIGSGAPIVVSTGSVSLNTWTHVAIVRSGTSFTPYINGVNTGGGATSSSSVDAGRALTVGSDLTGNAGASLNGYISNLRIVKGTAVYTGNFTVPTSALTAISGTSLLTCQSNRFRDASSNSFSISRSGDVRVTDFAPLSPAYPGITYNQSDITNWSGYFDGSGDYLSLADNTALQMGSGDFTTEFWWYPVSLSGYQTPFEKGYTGSGGLLIQTGNGDGIMYVYASGSAVITASTAVGIGRWNHIALVRSGTSLVLYLNGVSVGSATNSTNFNNTGSAGIGANVSGGGTGAYPINGYMSNLRIVKGTAVYTGAFTPPTTNLTAISGTSLLTLQNAAFTDNSTNNFVITPNGNVTVTGNSPFNTVGYWSVGFNGSNNWLAASANAATSLGTGNFTIEGWFFTSYSAANQVVIEQAVIDEGSGNNTGWILYLGTSNNIVFGSAGGATYINASPATSYLGKWTHFALVRTGATSIVLYVDGVSIGSTSTNVNMNAALDVRADTPTVIGVHELQLASGFFNGYLSNFRIVKGTAVYTSNFTPPTAPLTAISGTGLLTLQSSRFVDNSGNNITVASTFSSYSGGSPAIQSFDPFYTSTIASNGGSMYFDGSGDYLAVPNAANLQFGTSNFTVECWFNSNVVTADVHNTIIGKWGTSFNTSGDWAIRSRFSNGNQATVTLRYSSGWYDMTTGINITDGAWHHLAFVRENSTTLKFYVDGVVGATRTISASDIVGSAATLSIGGPAASASGEAAMTGYVSNVRITNGSALYTATFTPNTSVLTPSGNTTLLVNGMNAGIYDATAISEFETFGNPQVSTVQSKFGGSSIYFDGSDDVLAAPSSPDLDFGTGDFTIEMWVRPSNFSGSSGRNGLIMRRRTDTVGTGAWAVYLNGSGNLLFQDVESGTVIFTSSGALTTNTWQHIAVTRSGSTVRGFINGVLDGSGTSTRSFTNTWYLILGMYDTSGGSWPSGSRNSFYTGWMDDVRITRGIARYTANFTPPTQAFPTY